jgi:DNA uptake protein ComE-like DNA-binding protein
MCKQLAFGVLLPVCVIHKFATNQTDFDLCYRDGRVITSTARSCQDFASWEDAQAFVSQLPLAQQGAFDEDGDGVFCEELLLERRCDSFASWEDAQAFFETLAPTSASARQLDGDGDGVACETLLVGSVPNTSTTPNNISVNVTADTPANASTMNASSNSVITDLSVAPRAPTESARHASNCIDLNQASLSELSHLAGVTLFRADQIVRNRPYALVRDLAGLPGFSAQMIASINAQGLACVR